MTPSEAVPTEEIIRERLTEGRYEEAFGLSLALAKTGGTYGQLTLGWLYQAGKGVEVSFDEAEKWYRQAAHSGSPQAHYYLGTLYRLLKDPMQTRQSFERAASQDYAPALYELGRMYLLGEGVSINREKAFECFERAAALGHLFARRNIAYDMASGARGLSRIPVGILAYIRLLFTAIRVGWKDPASESFLRQ